MNTPKFMQTPKKEVDKSKWKRDRQIGAVEAFDRILCGHHIWFDYGAGRGRVVNSGWAKGWQISLLIRLAEAGQIYSVVKKPESARGS